MMLACFWLQELEVLRPGQCHGEVFRSGYVANQKPQGAETVVGTVETKACTLIHWVGALQTEVEMLEGDLTNKSSALKYNNACSLNFS